ncbi:hypothetical protein PanWU01x14_250770 [Parasponia andersonii]|uniref:Uncharacterized protein n=1 Tax=Parasponia andersonii TaxID=3476 RepID=A0A2P5BCN3_PARAD|nr:hypothetical protein PanWU01x14_250770 [Parasponia andersonii]
MHAFQDQTPCILDQSKVAGLPKKAEWLEFNNSASILEKNQYPIQKRRWNSNQMRKSYLLKLLIVFISLGEHGEEVRMLSVDRKFPFHFRSWKRISQFFPIGTKYLQWKTTKLPSALGKW